jgi:hypothetical protein
VGGIGFDPCAELPALAADPVIDGVIDGGLVPVPVTPRRWDGLSPLPPDASASLAVAWRPSGLYFFAAIGDGSRLPDPDVTRLYCGDAVELYVDSNGAFAKPATYDAQGTRQFIIAAPVDATTPRATGEVYRMTAALGSWTSKSFRAFPTADGYVVEAFVTAQDLGLAAWSLTAGARVAIDFAHDLSQTSAGAGSACVATRLGQSFLAVIEPGVGNSTDLPYQNPEAFCRPTLRAP